MDSEDKLEMLLTCCQPPSTSARGELLLRRNWATSTHIWAHESIGPFDHSACIVHKWWARRVAAPPFKSGPHLPRPMSHAERSTGSGLRATCGRRRGGLDPTTDDSPVLALPRPDRAEQCAVRSRAVQTPSIPLPAWWRHHGTTPRHRPFSCRLVAAAAACPAPRIVPETGPPSCGVPRCRGSRRGPTATGGPDRHPAEKLVGAPPRLFRFCDLRRVSPWKLVGGLVVPPPPARWPGPPELWWSSAAAAQASGAWDRIDRPVDRSVRRDGGWRLLPGLQEAAGTIRFRAGNCRPDRGAPIRRQRLAALTATPLPRHRRPCATIMPPPGGRRPPLLPGKWIGYSGCSDLGVAGGLTDGTAPALGVADRKLAPSPNRSENHFIPVPAGDDTLGGSP
ncbi:hypothetical protein PAHAL_9G587200 [Panicum hallii]|uniref:Uncharacterized protein n=1 Tax=Panicum hallii TaxID=206008 RepID=A0A2S3ITW5_9POAL|nr:hypothetical protein PAHAL_9G587200 [Panicum hallii]